MNFHLKGADLKQSPYSTIEVNFSTDDLETIVSEIEKFLKGCGVMKGSTLMIGVDDILGPRYSVPSDGSIRLLKTNAENEWSLIDDQ